MKEFDYEKAKAGAPVCTRDGRPARIVCWDLKAANYQILALAEADNGNEVALFYTNDGKYFPFGPNNNDLMMADVKRDGWVIIDKGSCFSEIHESEEKAMEFAEREEYDYTAIAHIEWEE